MSNQPKIVDSKLVCPHPKGFYNRHNNCYVNCILTILFHMKDATRLILNLKSNCSETPLASLWELYLRYQFSPDEVVDSMKFCQELTTYKFIFNQQHDAAELLLILLRKLQFIAVSGMLRNGSLWSFQITTVRTCSSCNSSNSSLFEGGSILPLSLHTFGDDVTVSLECLLDAYFNPDTGQCTLCLVCYAELQHKSILDTTSRYFIIQLLRYDKSGKKKKTAVVIPSNLSLVNYAKSITDEQHYNYGLHSQISHIGDFIKEGHFTTQLIQNNKRYLIDDHNVQTLELKNFYTSRDNYIICYERKLNENAVRRDVPIFTDKRGNDKDSSTPVEKISKERRFACGFEELQDARLHDVVKDGSNYQQSSTNNISQTVLENSGKADSKSIRLPLQYYDSKDGKLRAWKIILIGYQNQLVRKAEMTALILKNGGILGDFDDNPFNNRHSMIVCPGNYRNNIIDECYYAKYLRRCIASRKIVTPNSADICDLRLRENDPRRFLGVLQIQQMIQKNAQEKPEIAANDFRKRTTMNCTSPGEADVIREHLQDGVSQNMERNEGDESTKVDDFSHNQESQRVMEQMETAMNVEDGSEFPPMQEEKKKTKGSHEKFHKNMSRELKPEFVVSSQDRREYLREIRKLPCEYSSIADKSKPDHKRSRRNRNRMVKRNDVSMKSKKKRKSKERDLEEKRTRRQSFSTEDISNFLKWLIDSDNVSDILNDRKYPELISAFLTFSGVQPKNFKNPQSVCQHMRRIVRKKIFLDDMPYSLGIHELKLVREFFHNHGKPTKLSE